MKKNQFNVVVDTNVLISSILFGGKPRQIIKLIQENKITAVITPILIAELFEILVKKFLFSPIKIDLLQDLLQENFIIAHPSKAVHVVRDEDDNRVLEAAIEGRCNYIITGDKDLLDMANFGNITILKPDAFLSIFQN
ncbi:MAG TPA: putative toxin-antitoxin system toxin component, PIN family [Candidatus Saccharimonadales bacterium]|nr:putative toxin-antitoxin system toxin component, PIN family [Candidatus Saccharimonadales bacterium]